jgi:hypothetical protein
MKKTLMKSILLINFQSTIFHYKNIKNHYVIIILYISIINKKELFLNYGIIILIKE